MIINLNKELEEARPSDTIKGLEAFIALLRNRESANHIDVKLYFSDYEKLQFKLRTINPVKLR